MAIHPLHKETCDFFSKMTDILLNKLINSESDDERDQVIKELNSLKIRLQYELKQIENIEE